jgi:hypothetical protein
MEVDMTVPITPLPGVVVEEFFRYEDAERAVNLLTERGLPVQRAAIVGCELRLIERIMGRLTWRIAVLSGLASGAWFGLLIGVLLSLFAATGRGALAVTAGCVLYGAGFGAVFGFVARALTRGRREYVSLSQIVPARFELVADAEFADRARQSLAGSRRPTA